MRKKRKRVNIEAILADPVRRREMMVETIRTLQNREGISTTREEAEAAYDRVHGQLNGELFDHWEKTMIEVGQDLL